MSSPKLLMNACVCVCANFRSGLVSLFCFDLLGVGFVGSGSQVKAGVETGASGWSIGP